MFSETFEVLKGPLEVGKGKDIYHLKQGDIATIKLELLAEKNFNEAYNYTTRNPYYKWTPKLKEGE